MTPLIKYGDVFLKREDQTTTGSAKDRAISLQVENLVKQGYSSAVISSTGNAAISAVHYCQIYHVPLTIFVSPHTSQAKLNLLPSYQVSKQPISDAFKFAKQNHSFFLRQSTDPTAQVGYRQIATELCLQNPEITSIFIPVGSGTTLLGISGGLPSTIKIFAVQPASHAPIATIFDSNFAPEIETVTDALSVKMLPLKNEVVSAIKKSQGGGVVVQNSQVITTHQELLSAGFSVSAESGLALAGYRQIKDSVDVGSCPVILLTGTQR